MTTDKEYSDMGICPNCLSDNFSVICDKCGHCENHFDNRVEDYPSVNIDEISQNKRWSELSDAAKKEVQTYYNIGEVYTDLDKVIDKALKIVYGDHNLKTLNEKDND